MSTEVEFTKKKLQQLKSRYNKAVKDNKTEFKFEGNLYLVAYAEYLIEFLEEKFK